MSEATGSTARRQGAGSFAVAIGVSQLCAFARYIIFARMLGPDELGQGVAVVLVGQFFDAVTDSGSDRFLIQHPKGNEPEAQRLAQLFMVLRGFLIAAILLLFAGPIANFLEMPGIAFGLQLLALVPFLTGFVHLDWRRVQRDHDFRIEGRATLVAELCSLIVTTSLAVMTHSHLAVVAGLITRALMLAVISQCMAVRRFAIGFSPDFAAELLRFALPLTVTGIMIFFGSQGDRVLIGKTLGAAEVGRYSATMLMMFYPIMMVQRYISGLYLPQLVRANADRRTNAIQLGGLVIVVGSLATIGFAVVAPLALPLFFGSEFSQLPVIVSLVGALNAARFVKLWPSNMLLAEGHSQGVMFTYLIVLVGIPLALAGGYWFASLEVIILAFLTGELLSLSFGLWIAARLFAAPHVLMAGRLSMFVLAAITAFLGSLAAQSHELVWAALALVGGGVLAALLWWRERSTFRFLLGLFLPLLRVGRASR